MKIKCCLVFGSHIKENLMKFFLFVLIVLDSILVLGILFDWEQWFNSSSPICRLREIYQYEDNFNFVSVVTSLGVLIGLFVAQLRNEAMTKQTKSQYDLFNEDKQFSNYLEATKLLTDKDSTVEAKIAAMFSLADVAKAHPEHLDRIIQVLNKELIPLINAIEGNGNDNKYTSSLKERKVIKKPLALKKESELFTYTQNKTVSYVGGSKENLEKIKGWQYKGNEAEKVVSVALYVIRKITLEVKEAKFDFSNTILFDFDNAFDEKSIGKKFIRKNNKRIENAIFLDCQLKKIDFKETNFHFCKFINCNLEDADFCDANLWGASFENCNIKNISFNKAECEGVVFKGCKNLTKEQLKRMKEQENLESVQEFEFHFDNEKYKKEDLKYLIIIDDDTLEGVNNSELAQNNFLALEEYAQWKDSDKS